jgi:CTP synthase
VTIAVVGKYVDLKEAYKSLHEALVHGGIGNRAAVDLRYVNSGDITADNAADMLRGADGILVPDGFDCRDMEGRIEAVRYAREHKLPFFGICLGMQCAVIEFARNVAGLPRADSEEFDGSAQDKVIHLMTEWLDARTQAVERRDAASDKGGTMRLGAYPCRLQAGSRAHRAYGRAEMQERHRHRYAFNNAYLELFREKGMAFSGLSPDGSLVEIVELPDHPWFLGCQFHPEFTSTPLSPHPLFREFIRAVKEAKTGERGSVAAV